MQLEPNYEFLMLFASFHLVASRKKYERLETWRLVGRDLMNAEAQNVEELRKLMKQEAIELFEGDQRAAERWLLSSQQALGNRPPFGLMGTAAGIQKVRTLIGQLEHGVVP
tara:strand:- start:1521 stop:1853 length:333 start_codon:yes stop_codon:yes gene_type:complete